MKKMFVLLSFVIALMFSTQVSANGEGRNERSWQRQHHQDGHQGEWRGHRNRNHDGHIRHYGGWTVHSPYRQYVPYRPYPYAPYYYEPTYVPAPYYYRPLGFHFGIGSGSRWHFGIGGY